VEAMTAAAMELLDMPDRLAALDRPEPLAQRLQTKAGSWM
jgi:hypothetical protein